MKIVVIGTGNVAVVLSRKLKLAGHTIMQVYGRNHLAAAVLADKLDATACSEWNAITQDAELYLIAVSDQALTAGEIRLQLTEQLVVHTAGSVSKDVLKGISASYGVLYPFQTIRKEVEALPDIPLMTDANTGDAKEKLFSLAKTISQKVILAGDEQRMQYHLTGVIINNFSNYLYVLAEDYCNKHHLDFGNMLPLIDQTAERLHQFSPRDVQTGPAVRKDIVTVQHHINLLHEEPALKKLYKIFSDDILQYNW